MILDLEEGRMNRIHADVVWLLYIDMLLYHFYTVTRQLIYNGLSMVYNVTEANVTIAAVTMV